MRKFVLAAALSFLALPALAADKYPLDPGHTEAYFLVDHIGFSKMIGRFNDISGELTFDNKDVSKSALKVTIKTASIDTNHQKRDEHLRSPDFFNVREFPEMTFVSTKIEKTGEKTGKVTGNLTMLGVTKPVTLDVTFNKEAENPVYKKWSVGFSARGTIKRSDFGMKYGLPNLGDEVQLMIEAEGQRQ